MNQNKKQQEWVSRITHWQKSGKSARAWCQENKVVYTTFLGWCKRLQVNSNSLINPENPSSSQFIELREKPVTSSGVSIQYSDVFIHLSEEFNSSTLKKCLDALRGGIC